jgi:hypothetical protein
VDGLAGFTGVRRRMELKGTVAGVRVYDDYAHHPTEVTAQLAAAAGGRRGGAHRGGLSSPIATAARWPSPRPSALPWAVPTTWW